MFDIKKSENAEEDFSLKPEEKISELKAVLSKMQMSDYQREGLLMRIESGLIISESQLNPDSVRFERTEASAMDHTGKLQIIESAVSNGNLLVLSFDSDKEGILVKPLSVDKKRKKPANHASMKYFALNINLWKDVIYVLHPSKRKFG